MKEKELSHIDHSGNPGMVDISGKNHTQRQATASGELVLSQEIMNVLKKNDFNAAKGPIVQTAIVAATLAVKNVPQVIPLCHHVPISACRINIEPIENKFVISCSVKTDYGTGVEIEALYGVQVAALTMYDMCKALGHEMFLNNVHLESKSGGKKDFNLEASKASQIK